jgi:1-deoxy-D-xylulose-5-phosphate reductoisomerase
MVKGITILGATGTIGINTLAVIKQHRFTENDFQVIALTANDNVEGMLALCQQWHPRYAVMADKTAALILRQRLAKEVGKSPVIEVLEGTAGLVQVASLPEVQIVMAAIVGSAGLLPTLAAARTGKRILLANKEALVMAGSLFMETVQEQGAELLPIDSEHNAIFQCMPPSFKIPFMASPTLSINPIAESTENTTVTGWESLGINRILLTASGGPFRTYSLAQLATVTPAQACAHPNWNMGRKISVDSATMMNKGLELIEACWLFSVQPAQIEVLLHPQSIIHSMVEYIDGSVLAQLGNPDMRTPIAHALAWPQRIAAGVERLNLIDIGRLEFEAIDVKRFPCLQLANQAMLAGGTSTAILNAANEIAVQAFLEERLRFIEIPSVIETTLSKLNGRVAKHLDEIIEDDTKAREIAKKAVNS